MFLLPISSPPTSTRSLSQIWASRYLLDLTEIVSEQSNCSIAHLFEHLSEFGRRRTADKIRRHLRISCELAGLEVNQLFSGSSTLVNLFKVRHLAQSIEQVYETILQFYEQRSRSTHEPSELNGGSRVSEIEALSIELQSVLREVQLQHLADEDPRTIGFVTTQFHISTQMILKRLHPIEKSLIGSYFQLAEEQVCIPWQEICELAKRYDRAAPELFLVERWLSESSAIALSVLQQASEQSPTSRSRRGGWDNPQVNASMIRDLTMFQAYLMLCVLQQDFSPITVRLLPLCLMVFPCVNVSWELIDQTIRLLVTEVRSHLTDEQWSIVQPYATRLIDTFAVENGRKL